MKPFQGNFSPQSTHWIWKVDPAVLHKIDFLAYRLGLYNPPSPLSSSLSSSSGTTTTTTTTVNISIKTKSKAHRLDALAKRSQHGTTSSASLHKQPKVRDEVWSFSSPDVMKRMMQKWKKRQYVLDKREEEEIKKEEEAYNAIMRHPDSLFLDETAVLFRFGMGAFVSPDAPGFSGLFRQHWSDFYVTEMTMDETGKAVMLSRKPDWTIPALPDYLLKNSTTQSEKENNDDNENNDNDDNNNSVSSSGSDRPLQSFFTVNVKERLAELIGEENDGKDKKVDSVKLDPMITMDKSNSYTRDSFNIVKENEINSGKEHYYLQCYLHKKHIAHSVALSVIAQTLRMHPAGISVAGIKDYIGDTIQRVRLQNISPAAALQSNRIFRQKKWKMTLSDFSYQTEPLLPGRLFGNHFKIILRDVIAPREDVERALDAFSKNGFPNYYGCQRFSWFGGKNDAAFALLHHNWLVFAFRFLGYTSQELTLRQLLQREKKYPTPLQDEYRRNIVRRLRRIAIEPAELDVIPFLSCPSLGVPLCSEGGGPISKKQELIILQLQGAFMDLDKTSRRLTAQRLSSYLWNQVLTLRLHHFGSKVLVGDFVLPEVLRQVATSSDDLKDWYRGGIKIIKEEKENNNNNNNKETYSITDVVHPGFSFNGIQRPMNTVGEYYLQICDKYHLDWYGQHTQSGIRDFLEPPRPIVRKPMNLRYEYNQSDSKLTLEFALERGSYANVAITELMKQLRCAGADDILILPAPPALWDLGNRDPGYVTSMQDIYSGFKDDTDFVADEYEIPLVGEEKLLDSYQQDKDIYNDHDHNNNNNNNDKPLFLPESADPVRKAYRWGERHLLRNMARRERDEEALKQRLFEKPLAKTLKEGEVNQYAGHTVPMPPNCRAKKVFFKVLRRQQRFPGAPKITPRIKRGAMVRSRISVQAPFKTIDKNTWNVTW